MRPKVANGTSKMRHRVSVTMPHVSIILLYRCAGEQYPRFPSYKINPALYNGTRVSNVELILQGKSASSAADSKLPTVFTASTNKNRSRQIIPAWNLSLTLASKAGKIMVSVSPLSYAEKNFFTSRLPRRGSRADGEVGTVSLNAAVMAAAVGTSRDIKVETNLAKANGTSAIVREERNIEEEILKIRPTGWKWVKRNLHTIVNYGHSEGILGDSDASNANAAQSGPAFNLQDSSDDNPDKADRIDDDVVKMATHDLSLIHAAIPFLPVPVAIFCFVLNVLLPGSGTIISGVSAVCMGQPRVDFKEGRIFMTVVINVIVGVSQFGTITFLLVGWFWSMAWGGLLLTHSLQYREALMQRRQEAVATAAIEALTRDAILRKRDVRALVQERKQEIQDDNQRSMFKQKRARRQSKAAAAKVSEVKES